MSAWMSVEIRNLVTVCQTILGISEALISYKTHEHDEAYDPINRKSKIAVANQSVHIKRLPFSCPAAEFVGAVFTAYAPRNCGHLVYIVASCDFEVIKVQL